MPVGAEELLETAQAIRAHVRSRAGLEANWELASPGMREWYFRLARRAERRDSD